MDDLYFMANPQHSELNPATSRRCWLVVACAEHVGLAVDGGFVQAGHGKAAPLRHLSPGDGVVCYSPSQVMGEKDNFQSFTALGFVKAGDIHAGDRGMFRRDVDWLTAARQPIHPLLDWLDFTQTKTWGYALRSGLIEIPAVDFDFLQHVMTGPSA